MSFNKINKDLIQFNKVKFLKEGITAEFVVQRQEKDATFSDRHTIECVEDPHPDLKTVLKKFKRPVLLASNAMAGVNVLMNNTVVLDKKIGKKQKEEYRKDIEEQLMETIDIKGVAFVSNDMNPTIKISAGINTPLGFSGLSVPNIKVDGQITHGYEEELLDAIPELIDEMYKYLIKGKRAQLDMFDNKEEEKAA